MLTQYRYFVAIVERGGFTATSEALGVTQPTLTRSLQALEFRLGAKLLERHGGSVKPTAAGSLLLKRARVLLAENRSLLDDLKQLSLTQRTITYVNGSPVTAFSLIPNVLKRMAQSHPQFPVSVRGDNGANFGWKLEALLSGELDLALTLYDPLLRPEEIKQELLFEPDVRIVVGQDHPAAKDPQITLERLLSRRWILPPAGSSARAVVENEFTQHGLPPPRDCIEISDWRIAFDLIESCEFVAPFPYHPACFSNQLARFHVLPVNFTLHPLAIAIATRAWPEQRPGIRAFIETAKQLVAESELSPAAYRSKYGERDREAGTREPQLVK
jgi:DNA-binding transcriptional LysR family regulator